MRRPGWIVETRPLTVNGSTASVGSARDHPVGADRQVLRRDSRGDPASASRFAGTTAGEGEARRADRSAREPSRARDRVSHAGAVYAGMVRLRNSLEQSRVWTSQPSCLGCTLRRRPRAFPLFPQSRRDGAYRHRPARGHSDRDHYPGSSISPHKNPWCAHGCRFGLRPWQPVPPRSRDRVCAPRNTPVRGTHNSCPGYGGW